MVHESDSSTILLVDDEEQILDLYADYLDDIYAVRTATSGQEALDRIDDEVDIVLLDRRMPGLSGDEVLDTLRTRGYDCPVVMVTALYPDVDIITMPFNDYLVKPVSVDDLTATVERMLALAQRDIQIQTFFALVAKRQVLESEMDQLELKNNPSYTTLTERIADLHDRIDPPVSELEEQLAAQLADGPIESLSIDTALFQE